MSRRKGYGYQPVFTPELKPCKCGHMPNIFEDWDFTGLIRYECTNPECNITFVSSFCKNDNRAIHKWNNRIELENWRLKK